MKTQTTSELTLRVLIEPVYSDANRALQILNNQCTKCKSGNCLNCYDGIVAEHIQFGVTHQTRPFIGYANATARTWLTKKGLRTLEKEDLKPAMRTYAKIKPEPKPKTDKQELVQQFLAHLRTLRGDK